jgi:SAM-dependent methyltransferase
MEHISCNLCGSINATPIISDVPDFLLHNYEVITTFVKCDNCGLIYQNPRPTFEEMGVHYPSEYELFAPEPDPNKSSWLLNQEIHYGNAKRYRYITRYKHAGRLLDVGCATGIFLQGVRSLGKWELYGVEVNEQIAHFAQGRGLDVRSGTLEQAKFENEYFDVVTLWDVLEHLHDPVGSLHEIHRILKPDGLLVIRVPNLNSWDSGLFGRYWIGYDAPRHLYVFNSETLSHLLDTAGFSVLGQNSALGGYPTFLISFRLWITNRESYPSYGEKILKILYHPIMRLLTAPVFYVRGLASRGPQIVVTAVKKQGVP